MNAAVNIGILITVCLTYGINDALRFLCGSGIIQIDKRFTINLTSQNGKIPAYSLYVNPTLLSACTATLTLGEFTAETFLYKSVKAVSERLK